MKLRNIFMSITLSASLLLAGCGKQTTIFDEIEAAPQISSGDLKFDLDLNVNEEDGSASGTATIDCTMVSPRDFEVTTKGSIHTVSKNSESSESTSDQGEAAAEIDDFNLDLNFICNDNKVYVAMNGIKSLITDLQLEFLLGELMDIDSEYIYLTFDDMKELGYDLDGTLIEEEDPVLDDVASELYTVVKDFFMKDSTKYLTTVDKIPAIVISEDNIDDFEKSVVDFINNDLDSLYAGIKDKLASSEVESTKALAEYSMTEDDKEEMIADFTDFVKRFKEAKSKLTFTFESSAGGAHGAIELVTSDDNVKLSFSVDKNASAIKTPENAKSFSEIFNNLSETTEVE